MEHSCFWALLSYGDLHFVYLPLSMGARDLFFGKTFFDFVHPEEAVFAHQDLSNFMHAHTLGGSVTRCRLKNVHDMQPPNEKDKIFSIGDPWLVVDVIMYVVTETLILAFFHCDTDGNDPRPQSKFPLRCGDYGYGMDEAQATIQTLRRHDIHANVHPYSKPLSPASRRIFQILDNRTKQLLISWPESHENSPKSALRQINYNKNMIASLFNTRSKTDMTMNCRDDLKDNGFSCIQKTCTSSCTSFQCGNTLKTVERVLITYGNIVFGLFQLSDSSTNTTSITSNGQSMNSQRDDRPRIPNLSATTRGPSESSTPPKSTVTGTSLLLSNSHSDNSTCTESHSYQPNHPFDTTAHQQARQATRHYIAESDALPSQHTISPSSPQELSSPTNLLIPYARRICNFPQLSPISEPLTSSRTNSLRPSESYFRTSQPKNAFATHTCESCGTDTSPEWRRGPSGHKTLCNACGLRYSRSIARQTKAAQQREDRSSDSIDSHDRLPHKRPLQEQESIALPHYLGQSRYKLSPTEEHPSTASTMVGADTFKEPLEQHLPKTREYSDSLNHSASASVPIHRLY